MIIINKKDIFYENLDFLTLRMSRDNNPLFISCIGLVDNSPEIYLDHGFKLVYLDIKRSGKSKLVQIQDSNANNLGEVRIKMIPDPMDFINHDELEFTSSFFTLYSDYLDYFFEIFNFDIFKNNTISRIDYCLDAYGISVNQFRDSRKFIQKKQYPVIIGNDWTYFRFENQRHKLVFYNKRLHVLDTKKFRMKSMDGTFPYAKYIDTAFGSDPITRIEYRKNSQSMRDLENNSFHWVNANIRSLFLQYLDTFVTVSISSNPIPYNQNIPIQKDVIYGKEVERKKNLSLSRMDSYMSSYIELDSEAQLFRHLSARFGYRLYDFLNKQTIDSDFIDKVFYNHLLEK